MAGPNIQMPSLLAPTTNEEHGTFKTEWGAYLGAVQQVTFNVSRSGVTADRPTGNNRFIGQPYFDTDLGLTVFLKHASSNAWVKGDGSPA